MAPIARNLCGSLILFVSVLFLGCADPHPGLHEVSGKITLVKEPLKEGSILFVPQDLKTGTQSGAPIQDGLYKVPKENGLKAGKYIVQITSGDGKTPTDEEAGGPGGSTNIVSFDRVPEDWNVNSKQSVEVKSGAANQFNFDIPSLNVPKKKKK